jgi:hypothetical protein
MAKLWRNLWLDMALCLLLGLNAGVLVLGRGQFVSEEQLSPIGRLHAVSAVLLAIGWLIHIGLHTGWIRTVLAGRARGRTKLGMNAIVFVMMLLAAPTGSAAPV